MINFVDLILLFILICVIFTYVIYHLKTKPPCINMANGITLCYDLFNPYIKLSNHNVCREIFTKPTLRPANLGLGNLFERFIGKCLGCVDTNSKEWTALKNIFRPIFEFKNEKVLENILTEWNNKLSEISQENKQCSLEYIADDLPLKFILTIIFGDKFISDNADDFKNLQQLAKHIMNEVFNNTYAKYYLYSYILSDTNNKLKNFFLIWNKIITLASDKKLDDYAVFKQIYANYKLEKYATIITYDMFSQTLIEIIYANQDVTIPSMVWLLYHYTHYGSMLDITNDTQIQKFIEESARIAPIFPTSMPKITTADIEIDNFILKKGSTVVIDFINIGKSEEFITDNGTINDLCKFNPNKYDNLKLSSYVGRFGYGGRKCPGNKLANLLFNKILFVLKDNWALIPSTYQTLSLEKIELDKSRPFNMPIEYATIKPTKKITMNFKCGIFANLTQPDGFIGISVNEKSPYLTNNDLVLNLIKFFKKQNKQMVILIADSIAKYNFQAFDKHNKTDACERAKNLGKKLFDNFNNAIKHNNCENLISICNWEDLNLPCVEENSELFKFFESNNLLKSKVESTGSTFIKKRGCGQINKSFETKLNLVKKYIYSELAVLICGIYFNNKWYKTLYYSGNFDYLTKFSSGEDSLCNLIESIITRPEYENIRTHLMKILNTNSCKNPGFIGINIDELL